MAVVRWAARILCILSVGFILLFFFGEADFSQPLRISWREVIMILFFPLGVVGGNVLGWWREGLGAVVCIGSLLLFYLVDLVFTGTFPSGPFFALLALPGLLFGVCWFLARRKAGHSSRAG